jgi:hypothetical protein
MPKMEERNRSISEWNLSSNSTRKLIEINDDPKT